MVGIVWAASGATIIGVLAGPGQLPLVPIGRRDQRLGQWPNGQVTPEIDQKEAMAAPVGRDDAHQKRFLADNGAIDAPCGGLGKAWIAPAHLEKVAMERQHRAVPVRLAPIELAAGKGGFVIRVGQLRLHGRIGDAGKIAEGLVPPLAHGAGIVAIKAKEILKRIGGSPFLALKQGRRLRAQQKQAGDGAQTCLAHQCRQPEAAGGVGHLIVVFKEVDVVLGEGLEIGRAVRLVAHVGALALIKKAVFQR